MAPPDGPNGPDEDEEDPRSNRQILRERQREAGEASAKVARQLMEMKPEAFARLQLDEEIRDDIARARKVKSLIARRRAERELAGILRRIEIEPLEAQLMGMQKGRGEDARKLHVAEQWRTRLIEDGSAAVLDKFPGGSSDELVRLIASARRERDTGKPPGSARALFRYIITKLKSSDL